MSFNTQQLNHIETKTLSHYGENAESFWQGTKDHDVTQNYRALLGALPNDRPLDILDFGCGPGRDVKYFSDLGHRAVGLDGCGSFCDMARRYSGCEILHQHFLDLSLPNGAYDGIFANASLFHVPSQELPRVLRELHAALKPGGVLFLSNPRGNAEGWNGQRFGHYMEYDDTARYLQDAGFEVLDHYYRPAGKARDQQPWLAVVAQRQD